MDSIVVPWGDGSGDHIYLSPLGDSVEITSDANWSGEERIKTLTFATTVGSASAQLVVTQGIGADGIVASYNGVVASYGGVVPLYQEVETLPYVELDYIRSTGTQYIDTGVKPNNSTMVVYLKFKINAMQSDTTFRGVIGARNTNTVDGKSSCVWLNPAQYLRLDWLGDDSHIYDINVGQKYDMTLKNDAVVINGETISKTNNNTAALSHSMFIGTVNDRGAVFAKGGAEMDILAASIKEQGVFIRNYKRVRLTRAVAADQNVAGSTNGVVGEVGLWDTVTDCFFGNAGTGSFIAGNEI